MDFYKDNEMGRTTGNIRTLREKTKSKARKVRKCLSQEESYDFFSQIFKDSDLEDPESARQIFTFLDADLKEYDDLFIDFLVENDFLDFVNFYLGTLSEREGLVFFNKDGKNDSQYVVVASVLSSLLRMKKITTKVLFSSGVTKFFVNILNEQKEISSNKSYLEESIEKLFSKRETMEEEEFEKKYFELSQSLSEVKKSFNPFYIEAFCVYFEYFAYSEEDFMTKQCLYFFEYLQKYILDIPSAENKKMGLSFMMDFICNAPEISRTLFKRAFRCAYKILTSKCESCYTDALYLVDSIIQRDGTTGHTVLEHFLKISESLIQSVNSSTACAALDVIKTLINIPDAPVDEICGSLNVSSFLSNLGLIETEVTDSTLSVFVSIARLGQQGTEFLIENQIFLSLIEFLPTAPLSSKRLVITMVTEMLNFTTPDTAEFILRNSAMRCVLSCLEIVPEKAQFDFLSSVERSLSICEESGTLEEVQDCLREFDILSVLEGLEGAENSELAEKVSLFITNLTDED